jgi:hypothetical protein
MSAIEAVSRNVKTLADGTLRLSIDISPVYAKDAFTMFGMPDVPLAIVRLTQEAAKQSAQEETIAKERITGLALLAVEWCQDAAFQKWTQTENAYQAKKRVCEICGIESRKELNTNTQAAAVFQQEIRAPYMQFLRDSGIVL